MYNKLVKVALAPSLCFAVSAQPLRSAPAVSQAVDESKLVSLGGNVRPEANARNDRGAVADNLRFDHLLLQLKRPPEVERAVEQFLASQQNPQSPNYHKWITAAEFGERFGTAPQDVAAVTRWLGSHGFAVNEVHPNGMLIDFSGTAGQLREAFRTEIHSLEVNGTKHIGNMSDP